MTASISAGPMKPRLLFVERKSSALRRPSLPCLSRSYTVNLTSGCAFDCVYCYTQSFSNRPRRGEVVFYANTVQLLRRELARKRSGGFWVFFSTSCDVFQPYREVIDAAYRCFEMLINHPARILISTKAEIPDRFFALFASAPHLFHVQVGITTLDVKTQLIFEPRAAKPARRLDNLERLLSLGVACDARLDPLIPGLTDTEENLAALFKELAAVGVRRAEASFMFLRRGNMRRVMRLMGKDWVARHYSYCVKDYCYRGEILLPRPGYRRRVYDLATEIAADFGIRLGLCACKNPDITADRCHPARSADGRSAGLGQLSLEL